MSLGRVLILGGGPAGLAAAHRLRLAGHEDFLVFEREPRVGGLSATNRDAVGFSWDYGSHVYFSDDPAFDAWLNQWSPPESWYTHRRDARVWLERRFWPYPIQTCADALQCEAHGARAQVPDGPVPFDWWLRNEFGYDLCRLFFEPYNRKVWGYPLDQLNARSIVNRIAPAGSQPQAWGANATFRYPRDGSGGLWARIAIQLGLRVLTSTAVIGLNPAERLVSVRRWNGAFSDYHYDHLITTLPLPTFVGLLPDASDRERASAFSLRHSGLFTVGFGFEGEPPEPLRGAAWWYDPHPETPYYRGSVLSSYSPEMVPRGCWSVLLEVCDSPSRPVTNPFNLSDQCLDALRRAGWVTGAPVTRWQRYSRYGYPTPTLDRDRWLGPLLDSLASRGIQSIGRFGAWQYERGNMDHCVKQGQQAAERLLERAS